MLARGPRIGLNDVRQVEAAVRMLRSLDRRWGGTFSRDIIVAHLSWYERMLAASGTDVVKQRLRVALAAMHNLAGWAAFDLGLIDSARGHFGQALELAKAGGSDEQIANILYRMGRIYLHQEAPDEALKMFHLSEITAQDSGAELAVAVVRFNQAWACAMLGDRDQAMELIGRAQEEFACADPADNEGEVWADVFEPLLNAFRREASGPAPRTDEDPP